MSPFSVTVQRVPDRELGPLLNQLAEAGFDNPIMAHKRLMVPRTSSAAPARGGTLDLPQDWRLVQGREGESYRWPSGWDRYEPYRVFMGTTRAEGAVQIGLGETIRKNKWGRDRKYVVAFLSAGSPQQPLVEFVAADDYEQTRELVAVIRGSDGARRMYGVGDALPAVYTERFSNPDLQRASRPPGRLQASSVGAAREDDDEAILNHALIQSRRRYRDLRSHGASLWTQSGMQVRLPMPPRESGPNTPPRRAEVTAYQSLSAPAHAAKHSPPTIPGAVISTPAAAAAATPSLPRMSTAAAAPTLGPTGS